MASKANSDPRTVSPISHTTFDPDFIGGEVARRYSCKGAVHAQLLYRGINDVYVIRDDSGRRALRVWRAGTRPISAVVQEIAFLDFLRDRGIGVSTSEPTSAGERYFVLEAPEGSRPAALYSWAAGRKFGDQLDAALAERIGGLFAKLHLVAKDFPTVPTSPEQVVQNMFDNMPFLLDWVEDRPEDMRDYPLLAERLAARMSQLPSLDLPRGMCHQDMHSSNVHVAADGAVTFIDFDGCSEGYWLHDVKNFVFGNAFYSFPPIYGEAFERGYTRVRPYTAAEIANSELFLLMKAFRLVGGAARAAKSRGRDLLRFRSLEWFAGFIKPRARDHGLL